MHRIRAGLLSLVGREYLVRGRCVGLHLTNSPEFVLADRAFDGFSMVIVPLYLNLNTPNFASIAGETEFQIGVVINKLAPLWINGVKTLKFLITVDKLDSALVGQAEAKGIKVFTLAEVEEEGKRRGVDPAQWNPPTPEDIFTLIYTSGTTGAPKGAIYKHRTFINAVGAEFIDPRFRVKRGDCDYCYMPFAHSYTRYIFFRYMRRGSCVGFPSGDPTLTLFGDIALLKPTVLATVPSILSAVIQKVTSKLLTLPEDKRRLFYDDVKRVDAIPLDELYGGKLPPVSPVFTMVSDGLKKVFGTRLRMLTCGSAPLSEEMRTYALLLLQCPVVEGYGLTEMISLAGTSPYLIKKQKGTVGRILPSVEHKLEEKDGVAELCVKSPALFDGYYKRASVLDAEGFFHTKDAAEITPEGYLRLLGRTDFIVKMANGEFVVLEQLEHLAKQVLGVKNAYFYAESKWNNTAALVELVDEAAGKYTEDTLRAAITEKILAVNRPAYECPRAVGFVAAKDIDPSAFTPTRKLVRKKFNDLFKARFEALYSGAPSARTPAEASTPCASATVQQHAAPASSATVAPRLSHDETLRKLVECCQSAMEYQGRVEPSQNLFSIGANSRTIVQLQALIEVSFGVELDLPELFAHPTVAEICAMVESRQPAGRPHGDVQPGGDSAGVVSNFSDEFSWMDLDPGRKGRTFNDCFGRTPFEKIQRGIFLTGATGFLGSHVLRLLAAAAKERELAVHLLVRSREKLGSVLRTYFPDFCLSEYPVVVHVGDLCAAGGKFGLSDAEYAEMAQQVDCVVHVAALVKHVATDGADAHRRVNVEGTLRCYEFARAAHAAFHHASTTGLAGVFSRNASPVEFTEDCPPQKSAADAQHRNVYIETKKAAEEELAARAATDGVSVRVYRLGNITWDADGTFQTNAAENGFVQRVLGLLSLKAVPEQLAGAPFEFSSAEQCASALAALILRQEEVAACRRVFHIYNHRTVTVRSVLKLLDPSVRCVSDEAFRELMARGMDKPGVAVLRFYLRAFGKTGTSNGRVFLDNERTLEALKSVSDFDWRFPSDDEIKQFNAIVKRLSY